MPILQNPENPFETAILHIGINDLLKRGSNIDVLTNNIMNIANEGKNYRIKNIFVPGLTINNRLHSDFINAVNNTVNNFIENSNIRPDNTGLHFNSSGEGKLLNKSLFSLDKNYF